MILFKMRQILEKNLAARRDYLSQNQIEAYRLFCQGDGGLPISIDIYGPNAVIHIFDPRAMGDLEQLERTLQSVLPITQFFYKNRTEQKDLLPASAHREMTVTEYGNRFLINLSDYLDTGLFLDHRETRRFIGQQASNKRVLNTFAYTGSFSVYAARGGAALTHSVDLSRTYCAWLKKNLALNDLPPDQNWVYKMDTREYLRYAKRKQLEFDIIILDPPTFSRHKEGSFSVQKDHPELIQSALAILAPGGFILFSTNDQEFRLHQGELSYCTVVEKTDTIPLDFADTKAHRSFIISAKKR